MEVKTNTDNKRFSIFPTGWWDETNLRVVPRQHPQQTQTIEWVYEYIKSERARRATLQLRAMDGKATREETQQFKLLNFEYATFSGIFSYRNAKGLVMRSPYLTIDIDDLTSLQEAHRVRDLLVRDTSITTALCFVSPKGKGVKWIVELPEWTYGKNFREQYEMVRRYIGFTYGIDPDKSGSDVCRACFLPWDEECYINNKYLNFCKLENQELRNKELRNKELKIKK